MTNKPLNTLKIQLHRARIQVKKQLETMSKSSIKQQDVNKMLKEQLKNAALKFFTVPSQYELCIDDLVDEKAVFYWKDANNDEGYNVQLDIHGKLLSLSQPPITTNVRIPVGDQQCLAEQFLTSQYAEALDYFTLSKVSENEDRTRFQFEQFVGDYPLASFYCSIEIALNGQVLDFNFRGYTKNPPSLPDTLAPTETVLAKLFEADWTASMSYLSSESYTVPASGLYMLYESPIVYRTFNAMTGVYAFESEQDEEAEKEEFAPFPIVTPHVREETIETIIGVNPSMEIVRQFEVEQGEQSIVWREKDWPAPNDKSMNSFIQDRYAQSVKAKINVSTNQLKGFVWFEERTGDLELTFETCRKIAITFIATYYHEFVPYLQMALEKPSFNELHRAFFTFPVAVNGHHVDEFLLSINKTTGNIDMLMTPRIEISAIKAYTSAPLLELSKAKHALKDVDAFLEWAENYNSDEPQQLLNYSFGHYETKQSIKGINAVTGELILMKF
ncbi:MAG: DUF4901 domain-containing protein [Solibacillus sp.]